MMCTDYTYNLLKKDFEANKQIVLFVGAGINYSTGHQILWNDVMEYLFKNVLSSITSANGFTAEETRLLQKLFEQTDCPEIPTDLKKYVSEEFPNIVKAYIVKKNLGLKYIPIIQDFIYRKIDYNYIRDAFEKHHKLKGYRDTSANNQTNAINGLFEIARLILLSSNIKAVVTYNYDNFLTQAVKIIQDAPGQYFVPDELKCYENRLRSIYGGLDGNGKLNLVDIFGDQYDKSINNDVIPIYHVHGYIPPMREIQTIDSNSIVLSLDEFYDNIRNVYCWQTDTQMHFLSHYTCIFIGSSMSDMTIQRMLYNVQSHGNNDKIYCFQADDKSSKPELKFYNALRELKRNFLQSYGVSIIYNEEGYPKMYTEDIHNLLTITK